MLSQVFPLWITSEAVNTVPMFPISWHWSVGSASCICFSQFCAWHAKQMCGTRTSREHVIWVICVKICSGRIGWYVSIWRDMIMNSYQHHPTSILILLDYGFGARFKVWSIWNQFGEAATTAKCLPFRGTFSPLPHFQGTLWCMPHNIAKTCADELYPRLKLLGNAIDPDFSTILHITSTISNM